MASPSSMTLPPSLPRHLWVFVSKFTPVSGQRLFKLYRKVQKEVGRATTMPARRHHCNEAGAVHDQTPHG